jgi:hypothetical protein
MMMTGGSVIAFAAACALTLFRGSWGGLFFVPLFVGGGLLLLFLLLRARPPRSLKRVAQLKAAAQGFEKAYGLRLSAENLERLSYPRYPLFTGTVLPAARIITGEHFTPQELELFISCEQGELRLRRYGRLFAPELKRGGQDDSRRR